VSYLRELFSKKTATVIFETFLALSYLRMGGATELLEQERAERLKKIANAKPEQAE
jgi:hypothetical protein